MHREEPHSGAAAESVFRKKTAGGGSRSDPAESEKRGEKRRRKKKNQKKEKKRSKKQETMPTAAEQEGGSPLTGGCGKGRTTRTRCRFPTIFKGCACFALLVDARTLPVLGMSLKGSQTTHFEASLFRDKPKQLLFQHPWPFERANMFFRGLVFPTGASVFCFVLFSVVFLQLLQEKHPAKRRAGTLPPDPDSPPPILSPPPSSTQGQEPLRRLRDWNANKTKKWVAWPWVPFLGAQKWDPTFWRFFVFIVPFLGSMGVSFFPSRLPKMASGCPFWCPCSKWCPFDTNPKGVPTPKQTHRDSLPELMVRRTSNLLLATHILDRQLLFLFFPMHFTIQKPATMTETSSNLALQDGPNPKSDQSPGLQDVRTCTQRHQTRPNRTPMTPVLSRRMASRPRPCHLGYFWGGRRRNDSALGICAPCSTFVHEFVLSKSPRFFDANSPIF